MISYPVAPEDRYSPVLEQGTRQNPTGLVHGLGARTEAFDFLLLDVLSAN